MIPGFNLDVRFAGKTFHIQTEDSGRQNPVIMTHLFLFGTILASRRHEYRDELLKEDLTERVRSIMRTELKAMHTALLAGEFDELARRPMKKGGATGLPLANASVSPSPVASTTAEPPDASGVDVFTTLDIDDVIDPYDDVIDSHDDGLELIEGPIAPPPTTATNVDVLERRATLAPLQTPLRAPRGTVEFPTELVTANKIDNVVLAWLLEDADEA
ncbi:MAG: hypothetical protein EXR76_08515 [Myxococcales bacterium]|nr:hypothetical protein [Myxococcales bacterium]